MTAREADPGPEGPPARRADGAQTLERGLGVLRMLAEAPHGLRASEVAAALGVHRSIAYRLLTALTRSHFAARDAAGRYRVGVAFYTLAQRARPPLVDVAMPVLRALAVELGATACLVVPDGAHAVAVAVVEPPGRDRASRTGSATATRSTGARRGSRCSRRGSRFPANRSVSPRSARAAGRSPTRRSPPARSASPPRSASPNPPTRRRSTSSPTAGPSRTARSRWSWRPRGGWRSCSRGRTETGPVG
ncbi:IclR helix-turn-helix domain-containing protein [Streptomyces sp. SolWspMP-sol7th]|uniref:helix-turn-helix domain-containing protein n=1 Tax=Streptomyces sp. SolWspMP-sol7th TaxID=1839776 RepID=UPI00081E0C12|nr:IclR helix-turn-helix domain-containing protein [Streptomyces sp. SolWspMP-sol7th]